MALELGGHWITTQSGNHVFIKDDEGSTRVQLRAHFITKGEPNHPDISRPIVEHPRGVNPRSLREQAAIGRTQRIQFENFTPELKEANARFRSLPVGTRVVDEGGNTGQIVRQMEKQQTERHRPKVVNQIKYETGPMKGRTKEAGIGVEPIEPGLSLRRNLESRRLQSTSLRASRAARDVKPPALTLRERAAMSTNATKVQKRLF